MFSIKDNFLKITHLYKTYYKGNVEIPALQDVSLEVKKGEFVTIVGRSGSGKSTLLNLICGLDRATSGHIFLSGKDLSIMRRAELVNHRRFAVGMIFQSFNLIPYRDALANVALAMTFADVSRQERKRRSRELLSQVGLSHRLEHMPSELSGGEAQRVAIARALANEPQILIADEPTGNLDSATAREIIDLIQRLNQERGVTVIMVTHEQDMAESVSDQVIRFLDGRII